ncbi:hypothetical protein ED28_11715 [[Pantoea] beijingensis]|uniref:Heme-binding protein n=1 Tax=[Pantoea] beijingensis TaxID=1324864 RepID=A0A443IC57_9GAMM|nr:MULTISPECIES: heme-binding protein [Erwiniaceae]RWR01689.1 hypothetical protein ED28_11715 [[Pantoea] beijingensis]
MKLTLAMAESIIAEARAFIAKHNYPPVCISILDDAAHPLAFIRMDGTFLATIDIAQRKAKTAALFQDDSHCVGANFIPGAPAYSLENSNGGLIGIGGGVVIYDKQQRFLGAIGVSGATMEQDLDIARAAVKVALL